MPADLELSLDEVMEHFEQEYLAPREGVEAPDQRLQDVHGWLLALRRVRDAAQEALRRMEVGKSLCPLCDWEPGDHEKGCSLGELEAEVAATAGGSDDDAPEPCWCGEENPLYEDVTGPCDGSREIECECGGDGLCVCHNHGRGICLGCEECQSGDDDDTWDEGDEEVDDGE